MKYILLAILQFISEIDVCKYIDVSEIVAKKLSTSDPDSQQDGSSTPLKNVTYIGSPSNSVFDSGITERVSSTPLKIVNFE